MLRTHTMDRARRTLAAAGLACLAVAGAWPVHAQSPLAGIRTVFIVVMENHDWADFAGNPAAPYLNGTLLPMASRAEAYYTPPGVNPSLPNYLWMEAGTRFGIANDDDPFTNAQDTTAHLVNQLDAAGIGWKTYQESITGATCPLRVAYPYAPKHNPFVYFKDVTDNNDDHSARCIQHVRPLTELAGDLAGIVAPPRYIFITPDLCSDGHDACAPLNDRVAQTDGWLRENVPVIMNSAAYRSAGALFITWDEGANDGSGPMGMIVLSPFAKGYGYANSIHYDHGSLLRTVQEIFGVSPLLGGAATRTSLADLFQPVATPPPACTLEATPATTPLGGSVTLAARCQPAATSYAWSPAAGLVPGAANVATVTPGAAGTFQYAVRGMNGSGTGNLATVSVVVTALPPSGTVVEFYNPDLDHFFITADPAEQALVDSGAVGRWLRTGTTFKVGGPQAVCRFYGNALTNPATGLPFGPNSHFYTASNTECTFLKSIYDPAAKSWKFESNDFMTTKAAGNACPAGTMPIRRAYNDGFPHGRDSNHRITPSLAGIQEVVARGWLDEGIVMCAPP